MVGGAGLDMLQCHMQTRRGAAQAPQATNDVLRSCLSRHDVNLTALVCTCHAHPQFRECRRGIAARASLYLIRPELPRFEAPRSRAASDGETLENCKVWRIQTGRFPTDPLKTLGKYLVQHRRYR